MLLLRRRVVEKFGWPAEVPAVARRLGCRYAFETPRGCRKGSHPQANLHAGDLVGGGFGRAPAGFNSCRPHQTFRDAMLFSWIAVAKLETAAYLSVRQNDYIEVTQNPRFLKVLGLRGAGRMSRGSYPRESTSGKNLRGELTES